MIEVCVGEIANLKEEDSKEKVDMMQQRRYPQCTALHLLIPNEPLHLPHMAHTWHAAAFSVGTAGCHCERQCGGQICPRVQHESHPAPRPCFES